MKHQDRADQKIRRKESVNQKSGSSIFFPVNFISHEYIFILKGNHTNTGSRNEQCVRKNFLFLFKKDESFLEDLFS